MLTRRDLFKLIPSAALVAVLPSISLATPIPTAADYNAAWQKIAESLWAERMAESPASIAPMLKTYSGKSVASNAARVIWESSADLGKLHNGQRKAIGEMIATGRYWPLV